MVRAAAAHEGLGVRGLGTHREAALRAWSELPRRMHRWLVSCLRMRKRKLSALCPLVPFSSANGGAQPLGGTMHAMPHLQHANSHSPSSNRALRFCSPQYCYSPLTLDTSNLGLPCGSHRH